MADPFSPSLSELAARAREVAARRLAGNVKAKPREVPYPWASMGDWLTEALRPERIQDLFMGLGTDAPRGIRAFHGSPHSFERFDASKIGSGEGAQVYGHGLYFAENPSVAESYKRPKGKMYEVNINAEPEHFLDWDKPMSQQHPNVQRVLRELNMSSGPGVSAPELTGEQILTNMAARRKMTHEQAAQALREAGIPGIRYLDQGSRFTEKASIERDIRIYQSWLARNDLTSAQRAEQNRLLTQAQQRLKDLPPQTSNYVVFNDKMIDIIKKYGIAGLIAAGAYHQQEQQ